MAFKSILDPKSAVGVGVISAILVYAIYERGLPDSATMHATDANDTNIDAGRRKATYTAAIAVAGLTLLTRDITVFTISGATLFALDFHARHANASNPVTGNLVSDAGYATGLRSVS
jgi:hypothetical protein